MGKLSAKDRVDIINGYTNLTPMIDLAKKHGVTRQYVYRLVRQAGVEINDKLIPVSCSCCGKELFRHRVRVRRQKHHFCSQECHYAFIEAGQPGKYLPSRQGQRIARSAISKVFDLQPGNVVHHINRNTLDNSLSNLMVFRNSGDHIRFHRGFDVEPLWDGSIL